MKRSMILGAGAFALATAIAGFAGGYMMAQKPAPSAAVGSSAPQERKALYYRNPMRLADTSPVPKKDPMGKDYIPVSANEAPAVARFAVGDRLAHPPGLAAAVGTAAPQPRHALL